MSELYRAIAGSPITYLATDVSAGQTTIAVTDDSVLPDAPNICTIGYGENIETIRYGAKSNGVLQDVTRGIEGTPRAWKAGTEVARFYTAYEHNAIIEAIIANKTELENARKSDVKDKTFDNVKGRLEEIEEDHMSHLAETATDDVHGLRPVILWTGSVSAPGTVLNLSGNLEDFKRLVVGVSYGGNRYEVWELEAVFLDLKSINLGDAGNSTRLTVYEARLRRISNTQLELEHNVEWAWTGNSGANATINANGSASVHYIYGYR